MSDLLIKPQPKGQLIAAVTPASAGWRYVGFSAWRLPRRGERLELSVGAADVDNGDEGQETCLVVLSGIASVETPDGASWREIGQRRSVFEDVSPFAVYLPPSVGAPVRVTAESDDVELGVARAPTTGRLGLPPRLIEPGTMRRSVRGRGSNTRYVCDILPQDEPAESVLVVEVRTPAGHSSSYPPHKHDVDKVPAESLLEETYYHRIHPPQGFVFQRIYTDARDLDESLAVEDRNVVLAPRGYHPVVVPHGYESYYLNVMAGPKRVWHFHNDPAHEWMLADNTAATAR